LLRQPQRYRHDGQWVGDSEDLQADVDTLWMVAPFSGCRRAVLSVQDYSMAGT
jgi:hypothetical protein